MTDREAGVAVTRPEDWHLVEPPVSSLSSSAERLLLTSYRTEPRRQLRPRSGRARPAARRGARLPPRVPPERRRPVARPAAARLPAPSGAFRPAPRRAAQLRVLARAELPHPLSRRRPSVSAARRPRAHGRRRRDARRCCACSTACASSRCHHRRRTRTPAGAGSTRSWATACASRPGWTAGTTTSPRRYPRPRSLLFASNVRIEGLPPGMRSPRRLPAAIPADDLPPAGVLLWVREERKGPATPAFPPRPGAVWPRPEDFRPVDRRDGRRWERAGTRSGRHRFSIWVVERSGGERGRSRPGPQGGRDVRLLHRPLPRPAVPPRLPHGVSATTAV